MNNQYKLNLVSKNVYFIHEISEIIVLIKNPQIVFYSFNTY